MNKKNGWGLAMMVVYMSVLLAFLLLVSIMIYNVYNDGDKLELNSNTGKEISIVKV